MKVTQEKLPASQVGLEIEITPEMSTQAYEKALKEFTRSANIPGFRKGKVPRQVLLQQLGSSRIKAAVIEELIEDSLKQAIEQENIEAIGNFQLRSSFDDLMSQFEPGATLTFSAAVDVPPEVKLSDAKGLSIKAEEIKYEPSRVDEVIESYRSRAATLVPIEGRPAQMGDTAVVDFKGRLTAEDAPEGEEPPEIPGGSAENFQIELEEGRFIEGFIDGVVGMNPGETKEVSVQFPPDYPQEDLAGKAAVFTITLKELKEKELPELDDDFAQEVSEFETLEALRESLETRFQEEAERKTKANKEEALLSELVTRIEVEIPETLVKREVDYMLTQTAMQLSNQGMDIKQLMTAEIIPQLRERSRPEAIARIQRTLALGEVAKQESINVTPEAIEAKSQELLKEYGDRDIDEDRLRQVVEEDLLKEKILDWLEEHATVELVPEGTLTAPPESDEAPAETEQLAEESPENASDATVEIDAESVEVSDGEPDAAQPSETSEKKQTKSSEKKTSSKSKSSSKSGQAKSGEA